MSTAELYVLPISHGKPTEGIPLEILRGALEDPIVPFTFTTFSMLLGLGTKEARQSIDVLVELGYLTAKIGPPTVYRLTDACVHLLTTPQTQSTPIPRAEALNAAMGLLETCGQGNTQESLCRVVAVTLFGGVLNDSIGTVVGVSAQVTVTVKRGPKTASAMRQLEAMLLRVHDVIHLHIVLVAA